MLAGRGRRKKELAQHTIPCIPSAAHAAQPPTRGSDSAAAAAGFPALHARISKPKQSFGLSTISLPQLSGTKNHVLRAGPAKVAQTLLSVNTECEAREHPQHDDNV